jgi:hypothetical protein
MTSRELPRERALPLRMRSQNSFLMARMASGATSRRSEECLVTRWSMSWGSFDMSSRATSSRTVRRSTVTFSVPDRR